MDTSVAVVAVKALVYLTCLTAAGGALFLVLFGGQMIQAERQSALRFARAMAVLALYATMARVLSLSAMLGDDWASAWDETFIRMILDGTEGRAVAVRSAGLVVLALALFAGGRAMALALVGSFAVVASFGLTGHTGSYGPLAAFIVALHLIAVAYWVGALMPLYGLTGVAHQERLASILTRFGNLALGFVGTLVVAGLALLWLLLGSVEAVVASGYGRLVLLKLGFVTALLLLAAINKLRLTPAVAVGQVGARQHLRRSIAVEIALVLAIFFVTAAFTTLTGPPEME